MSYNNENMQRHNSFSSDRVEPNLNVVSGKHVPDIGLDLLMNKKNKEHTSPRSYISNDRQSDNTNIFEENSAYSSSSVQSTPKHRKKFFVDKADDSNSDTSSQYSSVDDKRNKQRKYLTEEEILNEKKELLYQFDRLNKRGIQVPFRHTLNSSLEEMKLDYEKIMKERQVDASIAFQRRALLACVSGVEFLNNKFDPFDVYLDGWSDTVNEEITSYDDIFEELHNKYAGKSKLAPELRLLMGVAGSGLMYHISNKMFSKLPGVGDVLKQNPDLMKHMASATLNTMGQQGNKSAESFNNLYNTAKGNNQQRTTGRTSMKGPSGIDELLKELEEDQLDDKLEQLSLTDTETISSTSEISINDLLNKKKGKKGRSLNI